MRGRRTTPAEGCSPDEEHARCPPDGPPCRRASPDVARRPQARRRSPATISIRIYRTMLLSRRIDDKEIQLKNQSLIFFQISGAGHEAILVAAGLALRPGHDWFYPYYRDRALCLTLGMTPLEMFLAGVGLDATTRRAAGVRCRRTGATDELHIVSQSSATGTQCVQAIGCAEAGVLYGRLTDIPDRAAQFEPRRGHVRLGRRRRDERRRVLGVAQRRVPAQAAGPLPRRRQRLRDLRARRRADARRQHLAARRDVPRTCKVLRCDGTDVVASYRDDDRGRRLVPRAPRPRARARHRHAPVLALALRRRARVQDRGGTRRGSARAIRSSSSRPFLKDTRASSPTTTWPRSRADVDREVNEAADAADRRRSPTATPPASTCTRRTSIRRRPPSTRRPQPEGKPGHDGGGHQSHAQGRAGGQPAHRRLRRGRRRLRRTTST